MARLQGVDTFLTEAHMKALIEIAKGEYSSANFKKYITENSIDGHIFIAHTIEWSFDEGFVENTSETFISKGKNRFVRADHIPEFSADAHVKNVYENDMDIEKFVKNAFGMPSVFGVKVHFYATNENSADAHEKIKAELTKQLRAWLTEAAEKYTTALTSLEG